MISNFERDGPLYHSMRYQDKQISFGYNDNYLSPGEISCLITFCTIIHHLHLVGFVNVNRPAAYFTACYTVLKRPNKVETAVHGCNLAFSLDSIVSLPR